MEKTTNRKTKNQSTKDPQAVRLGDLQVVFIDSRSKDEDSTDSGKVKLGDLLSVF